MAKGLEVIYGQTAAYPDSQLDGDLQAIRSALTALSDCPDARITEIFTTFRKLVLRLEKLIESNGCSPDGSHPNTGNHQNWRIYSFISSNRTPILAALERAERQEFYLANAVWDTRDIVARMDIPVDEYRDRMENRSLSPKNG